MSANIILLIDLISPPSFFPPWAFPECVDSFRIREATTEGGKISFFHGQMAAGAWVDVDTEEEKEGKWKEEANIRSCSKSAALAWSLRGRS